MKKQERFTHWESKGPIGKGIRIDMVDDFDARGLVRLYTRTDSFPKKHSFNMTIWMDQKDRLFARFWCHSRYIEWESYEIIGIKMPSISRFQKKDRYTEWVRMSLVDTKVEAQY